MSEPTLEQLAGRADLVQCDTAYAVLARELLGLRSMMEAFTGIGLERPPEEVFAYFRRYHGLDAPKAVYDPRDPHGVEAPRSQGDADHGRYCDRRQYGEGTCTCNNVPGLRERAETAERERDVIHGETQRLITERDAARALRPYAKHHEDCAYSLSTCDCTCGLAAITAALDTGAS